jgi:hypothetical protein
MSVLQVSSLRTRGVDAGARRGRALNGRGPCVSLLAVQRPVDAMRAHR